MMMGRQLTSRSFQPVAVADCEHSQAAAFSSVVLWAAFLLSPGPERLPHWGWFIILGASDCLQRKYFPIVKVAGYKELEQL